MTARVNLDDLKTRYLDEPTNKPKVKTTNNTRKAVYNDGPIGTLYFDVDGNRVDDLNLRGDDPWGPFWK